MSVEVNGVWSFAIDKKGANNTRIEERMTSAINTIGAPKVALKCDQEPAIKELQREVRNEMWHDINDWMRKVKEVKESGQDKLMSGGEAVILENSPVGESQSNGHAEQAVRAIQGQIRAIKYQLEENIRCRIDSTNPVWPWLIEFAGQVMRCYGRHLSDGLTPRAVSYTHQTLPTKRIV